MSQILRDVAETGRDAGLSLGLSPVIFTEQLYKVGTTEEFKLEGSSRLAHHVPHREDAPDPLRGRPLMTCSQCHLVAWDRKVGGGPAEEAARRETAEAAYPSRPHSAIVLSLRTIPLTCQELIPVVEIVPVSTGHGSVRSISSNEEAGS